MPKLTDMSSIKELNWDSNFFDLKVGELILNEPNVDWRSLYEDGSKEQFQLIYIKSQTEIGSFDIPADYEIKLVDKKITFAINLQQQSKETSNKNINSFGIYESVSDELKELSILAGQHSRFYVDDRIDEAKFETLYKLWIENSVNRTFADEVLVYRENLGEILGLITIQLKEDFANIGLLSVNKNQQGKGIGSALMNAAFSFATEKKISQLEVVTQLDNIDACGFYKKNGFAKKSLEYIYHFWLK